AALGSDRNIEKLVALVPIVVDRAEGIAHAPFGHHRPRNVGGTLQIVLRARRNLTERQLLGGPAAAPGSDLRVAAASYSRARRTRAARSRSCAPGPCPGSPSRRSHGRTRG